MRGSGSEQGSGSGCGGKSVMVMVIVSVIVSVNVSSFLCYFLLFMLGWATAGSSERSVQFPGFSLRKSCESIYSTSTQGRLPVGSKERSPTQTEETQHHDEPPSS